MTLPFSLKDIKVKQYQEIYPHLQLALHSEIEIIRLDEWVKIISILSGKTVDEIEDIEFKQLKEYKKQLSFLTEPYPQLIKKYIWVKGSLYKGTNNAEDLNTSQIVAIKTFLSSGETIEQLHNVAPCCYKKLTWKGWKFNGNNHKELSEAFSNKSTADILPLVFFCSKVLLSLIQDSEHYSNSLKVIQSRMEEVNQAILDGSFLNTGDGTLQLTK